jgi:hypothetical protein
MNALPKTFEPWGSVPSLAGKRDFSLQLRYLQTLAEISSENSSVTVFPIPIDLLTPFLKPAAVHKGE